MNEKIFEIKKDRCLKDIGNICLKYNYFLTSSTLGAAIASPSFLSNAAFNSAIFALAVLISLFNSLILSFALILLNKPRNIAIIATYCS